MPTHPLFATFVTSDQWQMIACGFFLGGSSGALHAYRSGDNVSVSELFSTFLFSGLFAAVFTLALNDYGISIGKLLLVTFCAGIGADSWVRVLVRVGVNLLKKFNLLDK